MSLFKRIFKIGEAEANSLASKLENPEKMVEQGIRDLKKDLDKSMKALAEVKATTISTKREMHLFKSRAEDYERKAMLLVKKSQQGELDGAEADRLATEALAKREESLEQFNVLQGQVKTLESQVQTMEGNIKKLKNTISSYENQAKTLKARVRVSKASEKLNKTIAKVDSNGTISMLERMKEKVNQQEALADAYGEMAYVGSVDSEIDEVLGADTKVTASLELDKLKAKMASSSA